MDDETFAKAVSDYKERIFLVILRFVRNREDAHDLTQEAFVKAYRSRQSFRGDSTLYTWIYRIAVNLALNYKARSKTSAFQSLEDIPELSSGQLPSDGVLQKELRADIDKAVSGLPRRQRMVFNMHYYENKSHAKIGNLLGITEGAVKANYHQAVKKLRGALGRYVRGED